MAGRIRVRETGATAELGRLGQPQLASVTGGRLDVATRHSEAGFSPVDLLHAALASCLVVSARIAASELGLLDRFEKATATVAGDKADDGPSRIETFRVQIVVSGALDDDETAAIIARAEELCTVSNTLKTAPRLLLSHG